MISLHCVICTGEIPEDRARRRARTCSLDCQRLLNNLKREQHASRKCRLCGRRFRTAKPSTVTPNARADSAQPTLGNGESPSQP